MGRTYDYSGGGSRCQYVHGYNKPKKARNKKSSNMAVTLAYKATPVGLENVHITLCTTKDAAAFEVTKKQNRSTWWNTIMAWRGNCSKGN